MNDRATSIRELAYHHWKEAGEPQGEDLRFWLEAEKEQQDFDASEAADDSLEDLNLPPMVKKRSGPIESGQVDQTFKAAHTDQSEASDKAARSEGD